MNRVFPERLKYSTVKPAFKGADTINVNNYGPVTLIPIILKIFDNAFAKRIVNFISRNSVSHYDQFGFQQGKYVFL